MSPGAAVRPSGARAARGADAFSSPPRIGWLVVARKELADHLRSARFYVLLALLGLVAVATSYVAADSIRSVAGAASDVKSIFLKPFLFGSDPIPPFVAMIGFLVPILGIAFGFDAISGERSEGTLPRLVSQPIYRDDVINGKFAAGLAVIGLILVAVTALVAGVVMVPSASRPPRRTSSGWPSGSSCRSCTSASGSASRRSARWRSGGRRRPCWSRSASGCWPRCSHRCWPRSPPG